MPAELPSQVSADENANVLANPMFVQISTGSAAGLIPGTGATELGKAVDSVAGATDTGVATLVVRDDALTTLTPIDGDYVRLRVDSTGALWTRPTSAGDQSNVVADDSAFTVGTGTLGVVGFLADETAPDSVDEGDVGVPRMTLDRKVLTRVVGASDANRLNINATGEAQVDLAAHALTNTNPIPISQDNNANTELNPIFVHTVNTVTSGSEVHSYDATSVAGGASGTHNYGVTGTTFLWKQVVVASAGPFYFTLSSGPTAGTADFMTLFTNGREGDSQSVTFATPREVLPASTGVARIVRTNRHSGQANEAYTTIIGNDVA